MRNLRFITCAYEIRLSEFYLYEHTVVKTEFLESGLVTASRLFWKVF